MLAGGARLSQARDAVAFPEVLGELLVEVPLPRAQDEGLRNDLPAHEDRIAGRVGDFALGPADHHAIQQAAVIEHRLRRIEKAVVEELDQ